MSRRDFRCALSGVSLLDAEVALCFLQRQNGHWRPISLPLFGRYEGWGTIADVVEGPNADLILAAVQRGMMNETLSVDFEKMGLEKRPIDYVDTLASIVACSQLDELDAVATEDGPIGFALLSAHVAAVAMEADPDLDPEVPLETLPDEVLSTEFGRDIYRPLPELPMRLRCKFGIGICGLLALDQQIVRREGAWRPAGRGVALEQATPATWLAEAMVAFSDSAPFIEALEDYAGQAADGEDATSPA